MPLLKRWSIGRILWGDRDDQAGELGNEQTPARNPETADPDYNDLLDFLQGDVPFVEGDLPYGDFTNNRFSRIPFSEAETPTTPGRFLKKGATRPTYGKAVDSGFGRVGIEVPADVSVGIVSVNVLSQTYAPVPGLVFKTLPICIFNIEWTDLAAQNPKLLLTPKASRGNPPAAPTAQSRDWTDTGWATGLEYTKVFIMNPTSFAQRAFWTLETSDDITSFRVDVDAITTAGTCIVRFRNLMWYDMRRPV